MPYPILGPINVFFWNFSVLWILWNFVFQKIFKYVILRFFVKSWKIGFGVGVISCDFGVCFLKSALYKAVHTTCMCFDVAKTDVKKGVNFVSDLDVKGFI